MKLKFKCNLPSLISRVTYNTDTLEMSVFGAKDVVYTFIDVPSHIYHEFEAAKSKIKFFNTNVRGKFTRPFKRGYTT